MGVLEDLARARTDYERGDWAAALDSWSGVVPDEMGADDLRAAAITAYLLGRRDAAVDYFQRAFHLFESAGRPVDGGPLLLPPGDDPGHRRRARAGGRVGGPRRSAGRGAGRRRGGGRVRRLPADAWPPRCRRLAGRRGVRGRGDGRRPAARRPGPACPGARRAGTVGDLRRAGRGGAGPARRVDGRRRGRRGLPDHLRQRLLHRHRGLPGDLRLRPGGGVDVGAAPLVCRTAGTGRVHRAVLGAPRAGDAAPGRLDGGARGVRARDRAVPPGRLPRRRSGSRRPSAATCCGCGASTTRPRRPTSGRASTATTRSPAWRCCGWPAGPATPQRPPYAACWPRSATPPSPAGCSPPRSTCCWRSGPWTRPAPPRPSWTTSPGRSARCRCWPWRRTHRRPSSWPPATPPARCPTCARRASCGRARTARTRAPGCGSSRAAPSPPSATRSPRGGK